MVKFIISALLTSSLFIGSLLLVDGASVIGCDCSADASVSACVPRSMVCGRLLTFSKSKRPGRGFCLEWSTAAMIGSDGGWTWCALAAVAVTAAAAAAVVAETEGGEFFSVSISLWTRVKTEIMS